MKRLLISFAFFLLWAGVAHASDESFTKLDYVLAAAAFATTVGDWGQTRYIAKNPDRYYEKNPILGRHPSVRKVDAYFATMIVGGAVLAYNLPAEYRTIFLGGVLLVETTMLIRNKKIGIKFSF